MKSLFLKVLTRLRILRFLSFNLTAVVAGRKFRIPVTGGTGVAHFLKDEEEWMTFVLRSTLSNSDDNASFVDVGVNIGQTLLKVKASSEDIDYIGFEPNPNCVHYLYSLINANHFSKVRILPFGLSSKTSVGRLNFMTNNPVETSASVIDNFRSGIIQSVPVALLGFDDVNEVFANRVQIIKVDVEGSELEVLRGLYPVIVRDSPLIICEILPVYDERNVMRLDRQRELEKILSDTGYLKFRIHSNGSLALCDVIGVHASLEDVNYLFCPINAKDQITNNFRVVR